MAWPPKRKELEFVEKFIRGNGKKLTEPVYVSWQKIPFSFGGSRIYQRRRPPALHH